MCSPRNMRKLIAVLSIAYLVMFITFMRITSPPSAQTNPELKLTQNPDRQISIAIGLAITSRGLKDISHLTMNKKLLFLSTLVPSFCSTASQGYKYTFYLAYDYDDTFFSKGSQRRQFESVFVSHTSSKCPGISVAIYFVRCEHSHQPARAQNDAMMTAYMDGHQYFYRINDDTKLLTPGWTEQFISVLLRYDPPNIGVTGPTTDKGSTEILTYEFVHRTHFEIFGFYYPRVFTSWFADSWITLIYQTERSSVQESVQIQHVMSQGTRYNSTSKENRMKHHFFEIWTAQYMIDRYINRPIQRGKPTGSKVIAISLYGSNINDTFGAIRLAQLLPVYFPEWKLRVFMTNKSDAWTVPEIVVTNLRRLGAELEIVDHMIKVSPHLWPYEVINDLTVDYFLIRNTTHRFTDRERVAVNSWIAHKWSMYCIKDHKDHRGPITEGLWGGYRPSIKTLMGKTSIDRLIHEKYGILNNGDRLYLPYQCESADQDFLQKCLAPYMTGHIVCHDSSTCTQAEQDSKPFPNFKGKDACHFWSKKYIELCKQEYIGQRFDAYNRMQDEKNDYVRRIC